MQFTTGLILLTAAASITSAWTFTGYRDYNYAGPIVLSDSGTGPRNCLNVVAANNDQLSSYRWDRTCEEFCVFSLHRDYNCAGPVLATSRAASDHAGMSAANNDMVSSFSVSCF